jgi:hypothetical protein
MIEPDDDGYDEPWTDGHKPHTCGHYVDEHVLVEHTNTSGVVVKREWGCPGD